MIPDDGSRLKVIENGVLKKWERRRVVVLKEKLYTVTFIKLYIILPNIFSYFYFSVIQVY